MQPMFSSYTELGFFLSKKNKKIKNAQQGEND